MLGRGTRPLYADGYDTTTKQGRLEAIVAGEKQNCLVLDFAGNTPRLGPINDPVLPRKKGEMAGEAPIKICPTCSTYNHASVRLCCYCGFEFPMATGPKVFASAGTAELIKADMPIVEVIPVDHVTYSVHYKTGRPPSVKVSYFCHLRRFTEYVRFEHPDQFSRNMATRWWNKRTAEGNRLIVPASSADAVMAGNLLKAPTHLRVWTNKQYPEIMDYCFDGSAFGQEPAGTVSAPTTDTVEEPVYTPRPSPVHGNLPPVKKKFEDLGDDIPF
jgi:DNA repair protein RadD